MKRSILMLLAIAVAVVFAGCEKEGIMPPELSQDDQVTAALKAAKVKRTFEGKCTFVAPVPNTWYDAMDDWRVTGTTIWVQPDVNVFEGTAELFVDAKNPHDENRGKYNLYQLTPEGIKKGLAYLHEAVRIDPAEPFAHAGLALGYLDIAHGPFDPGDAYLKAESAALQAIKLDPTIAEIHLAFGELCMYANWNFKEAERHYKRALELNPNLSLTHYHYAWALFLFGRNEEAIVEHQLAQKYDPFNPMFTAFFAALYSYVGQYEDSIREAHYSFDIQKDCPPGYFALGETYLALGREDEAIETHKKLASVAPEWGWVLGYTYALTGHKEEAEKILHELENFPPNSWFALGLAVLNGALGRYDEAFKWIAYEPHHVWIPWVAVMPMWKPLHDDPRHAEFVKRLNLPRKV